MSELQDIAESVSTVASEIAGVVQQLNAQAVRNRQTASQANAVLAGSSDPRPKQVTKQLDAAAQQCEKAAQALQHAEQAAKQFVGRIVGGGAVGSASRSSGGGLGDSASPSISVNSRTEGGGLNFLDNSDVAGQYANQNAGIVGYQDVVIHGNPYHFGLSNRSAVYPEQLASALENSADFTSMPVRLVSCKAGQLDDGAAQELADHLGRRVMAATDTVYPLSDGRLMVGLNNRGKWRIFDPR